MASNTIAIDLRPVAQALQLSLRHVESVVELLDAGNTVPFITRYRKDQTGGSTKSRSAGSKSRLTKLRLLAERKQTILRSIDSQGKLTPELAAEIEAADSTKRLEDLVPAVQAEEANAGDHRPRARASSRWPKKFSAARRRAPIWTPGPPTSSIPTRASTSAADALLGVGHILAEQFSERADLRQRVRQDSQPHRQAGQHRAAKATRKAAQGLPRLLRIQRSASTACRRIACWPSIAARRPRCCASRSRPTSRPCKPRSTRLVVPAEHPHAEFSARLRPRCPDAADPSQPGTRSSPRADRTGRNPRRRGLRPQPAQPAAAAAGPRPPRAGGRSGLQERLQAGRARRIRQPAGPRP